MKKMLLTACLVLLCLSCQKEIKEPTIFRVTDDTTIEQLISLIKSNGGEIDKTFSETTKSYGDYTTWISSERFVLNGDTISVHARFYNDKIKSHGVYMYISADSIDENFLVSVYGEYTSKRYGIYETVYEFPSGYTCIYHRDFKRAHINNIDFNYGH